MLLNFGLVIIKCKWIYVHVLHIILMKICINPQVGLSYTLEGGKPHIIPIIVLYFLNSYNVPIVYGFFRG